MVFNQLAAGFCAGTFIAFVSPTPVYMAIANCFVRPHLAFHIHRKNQTDKAALTVGEIDNYVKDIFMSFFKFLYVIGPITYHYYAGTESEDNEMANLQDAFAGQHQDNRRKNPFRT